MPAQLDANHCARQHQKSAASQTTWPNSDDLGPQPNTAVQHTAAQRKTQPKPLHPEIRPQIHPQMRQAARALALALPLVWAWPLAAQSASSANPTTTAVTPATSPTANKSNPAKATTRNAAKSSSKPEVQTQGPVRMAPPLRLTSGKSLLLQLSENAERLSVGNPDVADVVLINPREIYLLGKKSGHTNLLVWTAQGSTTLRDISVGADTDSLHAKLREYVPSAENLRVDSVADSLVLSGRVSDGMKVQRLMALTEAFNGNKKVINLLRVHGTQQVMLEVKVAEVSKQLLDELGVDLNLTRTIGSTSVNLLADFLSAGSTALTAARANGLSTITLTAEMKKDLVKVLAEPTITAVSGQEGSFLAGGKIFIPMPKSRDANGDIELVEKEFGVKLKFLPTVLEDGLINLRVSPEVSELTEQGMPIRGLNNQNILLPMITARSASTTVQLRDGESFAIGGLVKSNVKQTIKAFPILGELPVLGPLFRSTAFQTDKSELLFVVTPRLARVLPPDYALPTDSYIPPTRSEYFWNGQLEGNPPAQTPAQTPSQTPAQKPAPSSPARPAHHSDARPELAPAPVAEASPSPSAELAPAPAPASLHDTTRDTTSDAALDEAPAPEASPTPSPSPSSTS